jgi:L-ascorbate metabolism protein UlaG (beta-lactamase superfamily)
MDGRRSALLLACAALFACAVSTSESPDGTAQGSAGAIEIVYLANEGFLLRHGATEVLIDAFVGEPYGEYAALPFEWLKRMGTTSAPFESVELALTSHVHPDHFQALVARTFLAVSTTTSLWSTEQVIGAVRAGETDLGGVDERLRACWCEPGLVLAGELGEIAVELFPLRHVGEQNRDVQNLGNLVRLGGTSLLHVGDAELSDEVFGPYSLPERGIDVALLPYWYFLDADGRALVDRLVGARSYVAMHVPPAEFAAVASEIRAHRSDVVLLERTGDVTRVGPDDGQR